MTMLSPGASVLTPLPLPLSSPAGLRCRHRSAVSIPPRLLSPASSLPPAAAPSSSAPPTPPHPAALSRRVLLSAVVSAAAAPHGHAAPSALAAEEFFEIEGSGGVKALDLRAGDGEVPTDGDQVVIHYYGRLAAKRGWRFDSTYDHKDETGDSVPFVFVVGSGRVISGINVAVKSMRVGGIRRVIIPPSQGYQNTSQEPLPPNVSLA